MFSTTVENLIVRHSAAHFAGTRGYRLDGDQAHLHAGVTMDDGAAAPADWALQLWACGQDGLRGIKVAELPVGSLPAAGATELEGWTAALPPAGQGAHTMVLALASGAAGLFDHIHDLTVFSSEERFCQPSLEGTVGYRFDPGTVEVSVGAVTNPRDASNLSGSLSLELWALPRAYEGGAFEGFRIAGADLGCLSGGTRVDEIRLNLAAAPVPAGSWQVVLMLREWTPAGFVTRDYANFSVPLVVADPAPAATTAKVAETAAVAEPVQPSVAQEAVKPVPAKSAKPAKAAIAAAVETSRVSINRATAAELAAVKGLSKTVAAGIVAARPYADVEDVLRAKGMGSKLLGKLRDQLTL
jgi:DNA uptake protein ComE-like DNA-binding protein